MAKYDEDLHENHFFSVFRDKYSELFNLTADKCWMICVPRADVALRMKITRSDIENHILIREQLSLDDGSGNHDDKGTMFVSLNDKYVLIKDNYVITKSGYKESKKVKILFDEDFYNLNEQSYQIFCIEQPLEGGYDDSNISLVVSMETVEDCSTFLWGDTASEKAKRIVDLLCSSVTIKSNQLDTKSIQEAAYNVYTKAIDEAGARLHHWKRISSLSAISFLQLAIESYILDRLHPLIFKSLCTIDLGDKKMNRITRQYSDVCYSDLGIAEHFKDSLSDANAILSRLNTSKCPLEKLNCFKGTMSALIKGSSQPNAVSADDFLPMLVYLVLKAEVPNWNCNIHYIKEFHFSQAGNEELNYYLTSFEAAVQFITSGDLQVYNVHNGEKTLEKSFQKPKLPDPTTMNEIQQTKTATLDTLLHTVYDGKLSAVKDLIVEMNELPDEICQQLCHPLCDCKKCAPIVKTYRDYSSRVVSLYSKDLMLRNSLHYAVISGHHIILEWLLDSTELEDDVNEEDINHQTLLHLAALVGRQKCLLYLLFKGASVNKVDRLGNTALHLACSHGHDECVKGLVFHTKQCNLSAKNTNGDTPLHLAARWGYVSIISLLLEHGADPKIMNAVKETPIGATYDLKVYSYLRSKSVLIDSSVRHSIPRSEDTITSTHSEKARHRSVTNQADVENGIVGGARISQRHKRRSCVADLKSETEKQIKRLFRAINDDDFAMVKYLFGWKEVHGDENNSTDGVDATPLTSSTTDYCHPLCQCDKCTLLRKGRPLPLVSVNSCDLKGNTALHNASLLGRRQIVQSLLIHGAAKNVSNRDDRLTPLHLACQYNHKDIVMILIENGAHVNPCDNRGNTPLHFCCNNGHMDSAMLLIYHGADLTICNERGDTPLHNAARWNHAHLVRELLVYGAMYSVSNKDNKQPLDLTTDDEVYGIIDQAMRGELPVGKFTNQSKYADDPGISDDDFEHVNV